MKQAHRNTINDKAFIKRAALNFYLNADMKSGFVKADRMTS